MRSRDRLNWSPAANAASPDGMVLARGKDPSSRDVSSSMGTGARGVMERGDVQTHGVHKLDSAMSVLTTLLVDLEHELRDHSTAMTDLDGPHQEPPTTRIASVREDKLAAAAALQPAQDAGPFSAVPGGDRPEPEPAPMTPPGPAPLGYSTVTARADKLDSALSVLTRQLAELERELRGHNSQAQSTEQLPQVRARTKGARQSRGSSETGARYQQIRGGNAVAVSGSTTTCADLSSAVEAELDAVQARVSALRDSLGAVQHDELGKDRSMKRFGEANLLLPQPEMRPGSPRGTGTQTPPGMAQVLLPVPATSPTLSACAIASLAKVHMEVHEKPASAGSATVPQPAGGTQQAKAQPRRASLSPQPVACMQQRLPGQLGSAGSGGASSTTHSRRAPQTPIRATREVRVAGAAQSLAATPTPLQPPQSLGASASVDCQAFGSSSRGALGGRGRKLHASDVGEPSGVEIFAAQQAAAPGSRHALHGGGGLLPGSSPKAQHRMHPGQIQQVPHEALHGPVHVNMHRAASPMTANAVVVQSSVSAGKCSPRQDSGYPMSRSATPQGSTSHRSVVKTLGQRSQSPVRRRVAGQQGGTSPGYPHGSASANIPVRLTSAPHGGRATPSMSVAAPWQQISLSPVRRSSTSHGSASIPQTGNTQAPATIVPPEPCQGSSERAPSRSFSSVDLAQGFSPNSAGQVGASASGLAHGAKACSARSFGTVAPGPLIAQGRDQNGASMSVPTHLASTKSFAASGMQGNAKSQGLPLSSGSAQLNRGAHSSASSHVAAHRSPSRTRSLNPGIMRMEQNTCTSPCARSTVQNMLSPQVPAPPPVFAMTRCNTSMTSSNASFYFTPQHLIAGGPTGNSPVPASNYVADPCDPIDLMFSGGLSSLDRVTSTKLMLRRLAMGKYEIDGRRVSLRWTDQGGNPGLLVCEDDVADAAGSEMPLLAYLSQAANVAASLSGGRTDMPKIARVPKEQRLTFAEGEGEAASTMDVDRIGNERCESMRIACEQAKLREQAAEAYESGIHHHSFSAFRAHSLPPPPGLPVPFLN
mmetsp:Transcript_2715/g.5138  ORF Transcript_2715/g.5138 Transcript_2715/m.5138 type:complete len:1046 (-) Transcript_2715:98-3235(-)